MKGRAIHYSAAEMAWLEANRAMVISDYHRAFCDRFRRDDVTAGHLHALRKRKGWKTGRMGFEKGMTPHNKGKRMPFNPNSARTRFKKGNRSGKAAALYKPIGTKRVSKEGYIERKLHDGFPIRSRWRRVHIIRWEEINGPIPPGMALKSIDGNRQNTDPSNWTLVPRALLPRLNGRWGRDYDRAPEELKPSIMAVARLEHVARLKRAEKAT